MKGHELAVLLGAKVYCEGAQKEIKNYYIGDLLSFVMGRAPAECCWLTVMNNVNVVAVASLIECSCVVLCDSTVPDEIFLGKARDNGLCVLGVDIPLFQTAEKIIKK